MHIIVVGAGLIGISSAWFLNRAGHEVTVVDRRDAAGMETSFANGSMLTASHSKPWNNPGVWKELIKALTNDNAALRIRPQALPQYGLWGLKFLRNSTPARYRQNCRRNHNLGTYSLKMMQFINQHEDIEYDQAAPGVITIYRDNKSLEAAANDPFNAEYGVDLRVLDTDQLVQLQPALADVSSQLTGGIYYGTEETGDAHRFCAELQRTLAMQGVNFEFQTGVSGFNRDGRRIIAIETDRGEMQADRFVIAGGSYSPSLTRQLGFDLPIKPVKGYSVTCPRGDWPDGPRIPVIDDQRHTAIVPLGERMRVTSTAEFAGYNLDISRARIENLLHWLSAVYPQYADKLSREDVTPWAGLRPMSADGVPVISKTPVDNLYVNAGHGHLGWTFAAGSGKLLSDLISGETPELDINDYRYRY